MSQEKRLIKADEVAQHSEMSDCWLIIHGKVYDVTKFMDDHPGGDQVLADLAGRDATSGFEDIGHSSEARRLLEDYYVGDLDGAAITEDLHKKATSIRAVGVTPGYPAPSMVPLIGAVFAVISVILAIFFIYYN
eukprot:TRINITY_DN4586_c0_g1_i1.p1 TRINITY_DN4586_c0_g1~~TRINITY_DN4586_c0_g1_i1.p1  ORF type:complete len:145 (-),score=51.35 TRINITY_DN4586_c0_g1_i1:92-493(-)